MSPIITNKAPECLEKYHNLLCWPLIIFRLCNELGTSKLCSFLFGAKLYFRIYGIIESSSNHTYIDKFSCFIFKICDIGRVGERGETATSIMCYMRETSLLRILLRNTYVIWLIKLGRKWLKIGFTIFHLKSHF